MNIVSFFEIPTQTKKFTCQKFCVERAQARDVNLCKKRTPSGATDITDIIHEPLYSYYVGEEASKEIMSKGIAIEKCLE